jgi:hypothetical protein
MRSAPLGRPVRGVVCLGTARDGGNGLSAVRRGGRCARHGHRSCT